MNHSTAKHQPDETGPDLLRLGNPAWHDQPDI